MSNMVNTEAKSIRVVVESGPSDTVFVDIGNVRVHIEKYLDNFRVMPDQDGGTFTLEVDGYHFNVDDIQRMVEWYKKNFVDSIINDVRRGG